MMWLAVEGFWAYGWWWLGMMIICALMMGRMMMGHRMTGSHHPGRDLYFRETPEETLAGRAARGEIDIDEYTRLLEALQQAAGSTEVRY